MRLILSKHKFSNLAIIYYVIYYYTEFFPAVYLKFGSILIFYMRVRVLVYDGIISTLLEKKT